MQDIWKDFKTENKEKSVGCMKMKYKNEYKKNLKGRIFIRYYIIWRTKK